MRGAVSWARSRGGRVDEGFCLRTLPWSARGLRTVALGLLVELFGDGCCGLTSAGTGFGDAFALSRFRQTVDDSVPIEIGRPFLPLAPAENNNREMSPQVRPRASTRSNQSRRSPTTRASFFRPPPGSIMSSAIAFAPASISLLLAIIESQILAPEQIGDNLIFCKLMQTFQTFAEECRTHTCASSIWQELLPLCSIGCCSTYLAYNSDRINRGR